MTTFDGMDPIPVHVKSSDVDLGGTPPRKRRALRTNTYTLTSANPTQQCFPKADTRLEGWITAAIAASSPPVVFIAPSQAGANAQGGGAAQINGLDTAPFPVNTTDAVWISAATGYPVTVSTVSIYEETE
jgi:hypothetical protein